MRHLSGCRIFYMHGELLRRRDVALERDSARPPDFVAIEFDADTHIPKLSAR
jgi:hypothetical protein